MRLLRGCRQGAYLCSLRLRDCLRVDSTTASLLAYMANVSNPRAIRPALAGRSGCLSEGRLRGIDPVVERGLGRGAARRPAGVDAKVGDDWPAEGVEQRGMRGYRDHVCLPRHEAGEVLDQGLLL